MNTDNKRPATVLSGFLDAGINTALSPVLNNRASRRAAMIDNNMSEISVDANTVQKDVQLHRSEQKLLEMRNWSQTGGMPLFANWGAQG